MPKPNWKSWPKPRRRRTACGPRPLSGQRARSWQSGDPQKVVTLLNFAAEKEPSFYGLVAERMLGIDTQTGFADAILNQGDFHDLMAAPAARRAVALWQIGETEFVGPELNRAFVDNNERLDPAMAARPAPSGCRMWVRASEKAPGAASC